MPMPTRWVIAAIVAVAVAGCGGGSADPSPSALSSPSPSAPAAVKAPAVVTFDVAEQQRFKVEVLTQDDVDHAIALRDGLTQERSTPFGVIAKGDGGVNAPWTWHLDPTTFEFVDVATEVCDGLPSHVEDGTLTSAYYCPWGAEVIEVEAR